jgi:hypothetical protein
MTHSGYLISHLSENNRGGTAMHQIIRCGDRFGLVIAVTPPDADPQTPDATFYRFADWEINGKLPQVFHEISKEEAMGYFSGHADGLGWEDFSEEPFETLEKLQEYVIAEYQKKMDAYQEQRRIEILNYFENEIPIIERSNPQGRFRIIAVETDSSDIHAPVTTKVIYDSDNRDDVSKKADELNKPNKLPGFDHDFPLYFAFDDKGEHVRGPQEI